MGGGVLRCPADVPSPTIAPRNTLVKAVAYTSPVDPSTTASSTGRAAAMRNSAVQSQKNAPSGVIHRRSRTRFNKARSAQSKASEKDTTTPNVSGNCWVRRLLGSLRCVVWPGPYLMHFEGQSGPPGQSVSSLAREPGCPGPRELILYRNPVRITPRRKGGSID